jgi:hypothetical protein
LETRAGLLFAGAGALPSAGDVVEVELPVAPADLALEDPPRSVLRAEVLEVARRVPSLVRLALEHPPAGTDLTDPPETSGDDHEGGRR